MEKKDKHYDVCVTCHKKNFGSQTHTWQGFASSEADATSKAISEAEKACPHCTYEAKIRSVR